jgi:ZIP family zinc transporter
MGIIIFSAIAIHDLPEGLAIGSGFVESEALGFSLMIAIMLHNITEGMSLSLPFKFAGKSFGFILLMSVLSGTPSGFGAFFGALAGGVSETLIAACLAFAGGAMTYVICGDIIPESKNMFRGRMPVLGSIAGFILGTIISIM